jgi:hypothetical protein
MVTRLVTIGCFEFTMHVQGLVRTYLQGEFAHRYHNSDRWIARIIRFILLKQVVFDKVFCFISVFQRREIRQAVKSDRGNQQFCRYVGEVEVRQVLIYSSDERVQILRAL